MADIVEKDVQYSANAVTLPAAGEIALVTSQKIPVPMRTARVVVRANALITLGTGATSVVGKGKKGSGTGGTVIGSINPTQVGGAPDFSGLTLVKPVIGGFTWFNQRGGTAVDDPDGIAFALPLEATLQLQGVTMPVPATPYTIELYFRQMCPGGGFIKVGPVWGDNGGQYKTLFYEVTIAPSCTMRKWNWPDVTTANIGNNFSYLMNVNGMWMRFSDDGTTQRWYFSGDGRRWLEWIETYAHTDFLTPTKLGLAFQNFQGATTFLVKLLHWKVF